MIYWFEMVINLSIISFIFYKYFKYNEKWLELFFIEINGVLREVWEYIKMGKIG